MKGLAPHTLQVFEAVSKLDCIKSYLLVGGTALSLQMGTRQSEDLDFMKWRTSKTEKMEVAWYQIEKELAVIGDIQHKDILDIDHVEYLVSGVKFSFYACPKYSPVSMPVEYLNNLRLADVKSIGAMKMEVMLRRSNFRDYYDIYSILKSGVPLIKSKGGCSHRTSSFFSPETFFSLLCFHTSTHLPHPPIHRHLPHCGSILQRWKQILLPPTQNAIVLP